MHRPREDISITDQHAVMQLERDLVRDSVQEKGNAVNHEPGVLLLLLHGNFTISSGKDDYI